MIGVPELIEIHPGDYGAAEHLELEVVLPPLTGSAKQITAATGLRRRVITDALLKLVETPRAAVAFVEDPLRHRLLHALAATAGALTEARWWLDHRRGIELLREAIRRMPERTLEEHRAYLTHEITRLSGQPGRERALAILRDELARLEANPGKWAAMQAIREWEHDSAKR